jgi:hypothetical protein|tara:strand:- start:38 stop:535 length:498 start_codon:yes stop_codon:yes gene_type:complete
MKNLKIFALVAILAISFTSCEKSENNELITTAGQTNGSDKGAIDNSKSSYPIYLTIDMTTSTDLFDEIDNLGTDEKLILDYDASSMESVVVGIVPTSFEHDDPNNPYVTEACPLKTPGGSPNYTCWNKLYDAAKYNLDNGICFDAIWDTELNLGVVIERDCVKQY